MVRTVVYIFLVLLCFIALAVGIPKLFYSDSNYGFAFGVLATLISVAVLTGVSYDLYVNNKEEL